MLNAPRVLAIYGDVDPEHARKLARKYLTRTKTVRPPERSKALDLADVRTFTNRPATVEVEDVKLQQSQQPLAGIVIGYRSNSMIGEPTEPAIDVGDTMASGWGYPTGYLHEILRGRGLVYIVHAQNVPGRDEKFPGTFLAYAGCDPKNVNEVVDLMMENIARLQGRPEDMNVDWFNRSRELIVVSDALENETPAAQATQAALDELYGLGYDYHERFADKIRGVRLSDVQAVARQKLSRCVVTVSTPRPELVKVKPGVREYSSFPPVDLTPQGVQHDTGGPK